jgi:tetratricopeptide (TPR) repeat protein
MNNVAGLFLTAGEYKSSIAMFRQALVMTDELVRKNDDDEEDSCNDNNDISINKLSHPLLRTPKPIHHHFKFEEHSEVDFVYRNPIHVTEEDLLEDDDILAESEINCILLFNLALAYHLWALKELEEQDQTMTFESERKLKKALIFYEMSFSIQVDLGSMSITSILALVNNCASIYQQLDKKKRAEKFYSHMLSTLMAMIELGEASEVEQLEGFLHNVSKLILKEVVAPAA